SGVGRLSGGIGLGKDGAASLALTQTGGDNFNGGIFVTNGTVILDNANSAISGDLVVYSGGTAQIGNVSSNGLLPAGNVVVDGALRFSRTNDLTVNTAISGLGTL